MRGPKSAAVILTLLGMMTAACSSLDSKLVGEWQSTGPESVQLTFTQDRTDNEGFHSVASFTHGGQSSSWYWATSNDSQGTILWISPGSILSSPAKGMGHLNALRHKIVELSSNKLVIDWVRFGSGAWRMEGVVTFHKTTAAPSAAITPPNADAFIGNWDGYDWSNRGETRVYEDKPSWSALVTRNNGNYEILLRTISNDEARTMTLNGAYKDGKIIFKRKGDGIDSPPIEVMTLEAEPDGSLTFMYQYLHLRLKRPTQ